MKLLIIYQGENVSTFIIDESHNDYQLLSQANGCYININNDIYPEEISEAVSNMDSATFTNSDNSETNDANYLQGTFKIIHCGFAP